MMRKIVMPVRYELKQVVDAHNESRVPNPRTKGRKTTIKGEINKTTYDFMTQGFAVIRNAIPKEILQFALDVSKTIEAQPQMRDAIMGPERQFITTKNVPKSSLGKSLGNHNTPMGVAMQTYVHEVLKKEFKLPLLPTYSYTRKYIRDAYLGVHSDRPECEVSTTICLDYKSDNGKPWKIWVDNSKNWTMTDWSDKDQGYWRTQGVPIRKRKSIAIELEPGDILLYQGPNVAHWRDTFMGDYSWHMFIHFYMQNGRLGQKVGKNMMYDWSGDKYISKTDTPQHLDEQRDNFNREWDILKDEGWENNFDDYEIIKHDSI